MKLEKMIDHTMLKPEATSKDIERYCKEAIEYGFASVCVNSCYVPLVAKKLKDSGVKTCCVVGFPLGAMSTKAKGFETFEAVENGAEEIDMVINYGFLKDGEYNKVLNDIKTVVNACKNPANEAIVKVIIETCMLTDEEKVKACELAVEAGADFVKTSTGFSTGGATKEDVALMRKTVGDKAKVKASGGIRNYAQGVEMVEAGADRLGVGNGIPLLDADGDSNNNSGY